MARTNGPRCSSAVAAFRLRRSRSRRGPMRGTEAVATPPRRLALGPAPRCAFNVEGQCTLWRSGDAHRLAASSAGAATPYGFAARSAVAQKPLGPRRGATLSEGLVRHGAEYVFTPSPPADQGSLPNHRSVPEGRVVPLRGGRVTHSPTAGSSD